MAGARSDLSAAAGCHNSVLQVRGAGGKKGNKNGQMRPVKIQKKRKKWDAQGREWEQLIM